MFKKTLGFGTLISMIALLAILNSTTPSGAGPLGILAVFILIYLLAVGVFTFFLYKSSEVVNKNLRRKSISSLSFEKSYYYASVLALSPVMMVAMMSVGRVGAYQIMLVIFFVIISLVYISRRTA